MQHNWHSAEQLEYDVQTEQMLLNMGPQHPSTHGVLRLALRTDGELITGVVPHIGYLHRCAEKIGEKLTARQFVPYTDRLDYLAAMNMNLGWALAVEKLLGIEVSEKTMHLRVLVCELDRIASHLVGTCALGLDLGSFTPFMWCFREREKILNLFEALCGARMLYNYIVPGGVMADLPRGWLQQCQWFLDQFQPVIDDLHALLTSNEIFIRRTAGIGVLSPQAAISYGCTGPVLRATGVCWDLRRHGEPIYTRMYQDYQFHIAALDGRCYPQKANQPKVPRAAVRGDCWHRYYVRLLEIIESAALVRQAIDKYSGQRRGAVGADSAADKTAQGRRLSGNRSSQRTARIFDCWRWFARALAGTHPQSQFLQSLGPGGNLSRMPVGRRPGNCWLAGYCPGRDRPVGN
jgi:NADH-quinone oxidoreductase subunit D